MTRSVRLAIVLAPLLFFAPHLSMSADGVAKSTATEDRESADAAPINSAREMFDLFGIDESLFYKFVHGRPTSEAEQEPIARVLVRLPQIKLVDVERWAKQRVNWNDVVEQPARYQREFVRLEGRVRRVTIEKPLPEYSRRYDLEQYYRCEMVLEDGERPMVVFARVAPRAWKLDSPINERTSALAVFLKAGPETSGGVSELYFAADRIAWLPETRLGKLGMDYGLFDTVEQLRPITHEDRECFFQLLRAAGQLESGASSESVDQSATLAPLMKSPEEHLGELYSFRGVARRAIKIHVTDPETVTRFGFDHYFELVVFLELDGVLKVGDRKVSSYPVVLCLRELPAGMPTGENVTELVRASGFMFKKWPYSTQLTDEKNPDLRMFSPLLVGRTVVWESADRATLSSIDPWMAGILCGSIVAVAIVAWWFSRREQKLHAEVVAKTFELPRGQSLNDLDLIAPPQGDD
jgi:hypothetical protein